MIARALQTYGFYIGDSGGTTAIKLQNTSAEGRGQHWHVNADALCGLPFTSEYWDVIAESYDPTGRRRAVTPLLQFLVAAPLVIVFAVVCLREPLRVALPIYTALIPFGGLVSLGSSSFSSASSLLGLLLGAGLMTQFVTGRQLTSQLSAAVPVWTVFLGLAAATTLWTVNRSVTISGLMVLTSLVAVFILVTLSDVERATCGAPRRRS